MTELIHIHSRDVKERLIKRGHELVDTETNKKIPNFDIFLFEKNDKFLLDLTEITLEKEIEKRIKKEVDGFLKKIK